METTTSSIFNSTILTKTTQLTSLQWTSTTIINQRPALIFCILATITHTIFWIQVCCIPAYRHRTMQWLLIVAHFIIFSTPIIISVIQLKNAWATLFIFSSQNCDIGDMKTTVQVVNAFCRYALPIFLNVLTILLSFYHVHHKTYRHGTLIRMSA